MSLFSASLASLCHSLKGTGILDNEAAVCDDPGWMKRAGALNASLHETFAPSGADSMPLADFIGKQPLTSRVRTSSSARVRIIGVARSGQT